MSNEKPAAGVKPEDPPVTKLVSLERSRAIGRGLRSMYSDVVAEAVPDSFLDILQDADQKAAATGKQDTLPEGGTAKIFVLGANISANKGVK